MRRDLMGPDLHRPLEIPTYSKPKRRRQPPRSIPPRGLPVARRDPVICTHRGHRRISKFWFRVLSWRGLFPSDASVLWLRRINQHSNRRQSPRDHDSYRQNPRRGRRKAAGRLSFLEKRARRFPSAFHLNFREQILGQTQAFAGLKK
jgi:hypothetical protein